MKKALFLTLALFSFKQCLAISDEDFTAITEDHRVYFDKLYNTGDEEIEPTYITLAKALKTKKTLDNEGPLFVVATGEDLMPTRPRQDHDLLTIAFKKTPHQKITRFFDRNLHATLLLDVKYGDGFVIDQTTIPKRGQVLRTNIFHLSKVYLPPTLKSLWLSNLAQDIVAIEDYFLGNCENLTSVKFSPFTTVETLGTGFGWECTNLSSLDLNSFENLATVKCDFLKGCKKMRHVNMDGLPDIEFLHDSTGKKCRCYKVQSTSQG